ncbi:hypothetical protein RJ641_016966, partial [Dillenia turbinata]
KSEKISEFSRNENLQRLASISFLPPSYLLSPSPLLSFFTKFAVRQLNESSNVQKALKKQKFDHLILGPAAGQGLPNRLQCQGLNAINKIKSSSGSNSGVYVSFVTVFVVNKSAESGRSLEYFNVGNASYTKVERSMAILNVFISFIQVMMPWSNVIILTDPASELPVHQDRVIAHPIQGDYSRNKLMLQRIRSYIEFLERKLKEPAREQGHINNYIFTDSDVAVVGDLSEIFNDHANFHLALTFRNNKEQPLNSGFIAVRGTPDGLLRAKTFLRNVLEVYISKYLKASRMQGDQLALAWVVKSHPSFDPKRFMKPQAFLEEIGGASVLFLPCAIYNWTPPEGAGQFHGMPLDVKVISEFLEVVVHFKGSRKRLMLESWNFFNSSAASDISDMLCLVLGSGRTKYDF